VAKLRTLRYGDAAEGLLTHVCSCGNGEGSITVVHNSLLMKLAKFKSNK